MQENKMKRILVIPLFGLMFALKVIAGQNQDAIISLDLDPSTQAIDSVLVVRADSAQFGVAIRINQIVNIKGYSVRLTVDTSKYTYVNYFLSDTYNSNILGTPMGFPIDNKTSIELSAAAASAVTVTSGYLGTILLKSKLSAIDSFGISISYAEITDQANSLDLITTFKGCKYRVLFPLPVLSVVAEAHGSIVIPETRNISVEQDSLITIKAAANLGYVFRNWVI